MKLMLAGAFGAAAVATAAMAQIQNTATLNPQTLRPVSSFAGIASLPERSRAIFNEIGKVVTHPRCMNCHPVGDHPLQGADHHEHMPPVPRGEANDGVPGLTCQACHTERNFTLTGLGESATYRSILGHPRWSLAPKEFAWEGQSLGQICRQIKDENRNGGRTLALLQEHFARDDLVAWGWAPGAGREPAPGSQAELGALVQAWIDTGAECPN